MPATTAQLRRAARNAAEEGRYGPAARLFDLAADRHPGRENLRSELNQRDVRALRARAEECRRAAEREEPYVA